MRPEQVFEQLEAISSNSDDFNYLSEQLVLKWKTDPDRERFAAPILAFMETFPTLDYGMPGQLVHFLETLNNHEADVVASVQRSPMPYTILMINRIINGDSKRSKSELIAILEDVSQDTSVDAPTRERAQDYVNFQNSDEPTP